MGYSEERLVFLDTLVTHSNNPLICELYAEPNVTHNNLLISSCHTKRGPYSQFLLIRKNCTLVESYEKHSREMKQHYILRDYLENLLRKKVE